MYHQNSQLFQYAKRVIDNSHLDVHYTVEKDQKKGRSYIIHIFFKKLSTQYVLANAESTYSKSMKLYDLFGYSNTTSNPQVSVL